MKRALSILVLSCSVFFQLACQRNFEPQTPTEVPSPVDDVEDHVHNDPAVDPIADLGCIKATSRQIASVDDGNDKKTQFLNLCTQKTGSAYWCQQLVRPNTNSASTFGCTYGPNQVHQLINPDENTWQYPIAAVKLLQELTSKGIHACEIYNWWRPEPYNKNVGGSPGRHPYGTSVDVRFCSRDDANNAFSELCKLRKQNRLRALGDYGSSSLHLGIGDAVANTWGMDCP